MAILDCIRQRRSIRQYLPKQVEEEKLQRVLEAGRLAPSASNRQEWRYVVVRDGEKRRKLADAAGSQRFVADAAVVIACCAETDGHRMLCGQLSYPIDVAISIDHMTLQAVAEGLGTCWIGAFREDEVKRILKIPEEVPVVELLTLGYPAREPRQRERKPLDEIVRYEEW